MIELDGSHGEGGGQIIRTALALSILTQKAFRITNIRKNRSTPGLKKQHISCIKAAAELSNAYVEGNLFGSETVEFVPRTLKNRQIEINIGSAGSITLLLQSLLPAIIFIESNIKIIGGTDVRWSMPIDYLRNIIVPFLSNYTNLEITCEKRGYFPKGGGIVNIKTKPIYRRLDFDSFEKFHQYIFGNPAIELHKKGVLRLIKGISHASKDLQQKEVAERQAKTAEIGLSRMAKVDMQKEYANTESTGSGIMIYGIYDTGSKQYRIGVDVLGKERVKAEEIGRQASEKMMRYIEKEDSAVVDEWMQDNIIPFLGLFGGRIKTCAITDHTKSNIYTCEKFLDLEYITEDRSMDLKEKRKTKEERENKEEKKDKKDDKEKLGKIEKEKRINKDKEIKKEKKIDKNNQIEASFISVLSSSRS